VTAAPVLPHIDAVTSLLTAAGIVTSLGVAQPGTAAPYCVLYPSAGQSLPGSLADPVSYVDVLLQLTCVGETAEQALSVADRARAALSVELTVAGREGLRPEELGGPPVQRDDDVVPPLFYAPVQYRLRSVPA
jgi:hypothetical protein